MSCLRPFGWILLLCLSASLSAQDDPDFTRLTSLLSETLAQAGPARQTGDRSEMYRYTDDGWEMQLLAAWSGQRWLLLAAHLDHPERRVGSPGRWEERYRELLRAYAPEWLERLPLPDLFEVPPPGYNPAVPGEVRSRRFTWQGYWYEARWINSGGVDDDAEWSLVSYDLVAQPPPEDTQGDSGLN
ncbi:hypothetical protein [Wenzhouxiangella marina]|uniref:Uncharacterized protein n=1 Tax=Wenzhouxiangella marina TaxID=1579979 RepID=A0A0K0XSJ7_9GAMM|nr:hypothetical protein [Wenzhouxiangella marina]AKS40684.1 hypothetical protein WM2015_298 [Wenzhouxiangella marina]MBB6088454.1 hypothetical protein [Wenzhouxiangella marina]